MRGLLLALLLAGCVMPTPSAPSSDALAFGPLVLVSTKDTGSEPIVVADADGRLFVSAMPGNVADHPIGVGVVSRLWRSEDAGASWTRLDPHPAGAPDDRGAGGGDSAIAVAPDGTIHVSDLWGGDLVAASSRDHGASWTRVPLASSVPLLDRQWMTADHEGRAFILARSLSPGAAEWVLRSDDKGTSWTLVGRAWTYGPGMSSSALSGNVVVSPRSDHLHALFVCDEDGRVLCVASSADAGVTWTRVEVAKRNGTIGDIFPAIAADLSGTLYATWCERDGRTTAIWSTTSRDDGASWSDPTQVPTPNGTVLMPGIVGGHEDQVAVAWYGTDLSVDPNDADAARAALWHVWVARSSDAGASWEVARATDAPIHKGSLSTIGVAARARPPDWTLGDLLSLAALPDGRIVVAFTTGSQGDAPPRPAILVQADGARLT